MFKEFQFKNDKNNFTNLLLIDKNYGSGRKKKKKKIMLKFVECEEPIKMSKLWQRRRAWEKLNHQFSSPFTLLFLLFELNFHISNFYENISP